MRGWLRLVCLLVWAMAAPALLGCGGGTGTGFGTMGMPGIPSPTRIASNIVLADVDIDHQPGPLFVVDSGSPFTLFDPTDYPAVDFGPKVQVGVDVSFGQFTVDEVPALQISLLGAGVALPPIIGGNLLRQFVTEIDYRSMHMRLGDGAPATGVEEPGGSVPFLLRGGGRVLQNGTIISFPATRVVLTVELEGVPHSLMLDTGASEVAVRTSLYDALVADGRAQLSGLPISTAMGPTTAEVTRARTITVGGQTVTNAAVMTVGDGLLDTLQEEIAMPVDGLLGGSYLREFLLTIDYPKRTLRLRRYSPPVAIADEFKRIGIDLGLASAAHRYTVGKVYTGTDAERQQLRFGDELVSIDGQSLDTLDAIAADGLLSGEVGAIRQVGLGTTAVAALANTTVAVRVDDLIPAP
jgi:hypothetical protein